MGTQEIEIPQTSCLVSFMSHLKWLHKLMETKPSVLPSVRRRADDKRWLPRLLQLLLSPHGSSSDTKLLL